MEKSKRSTFNYILCGIIVLPILDKDLTKENTDIISDEYKCRYSQQRTWTDNSESWSEYTAFRSPNSILVQYGSTTPLGVAQNQKLKLFNKIQANQTQ